MTKDKVELHIIGTRSKWSNSASLRIRTIHRGPDGKVRASTTKELRSHVSGETKGEKLRAALKEFIQMYNLFDNEVI